MVDMTVTCCVPIAALTAFVALASNFVVEKGSRRSAKIVFALGGVLFVLGLGGVSGRGAGILSMVLSIAYAVFTLIAVDCYLRKHGRKR